MANDYYTHGAYPSTGAPGRSADMRSELDAVSAAFNKCPPLLGSAFKIPYCVAGESNYAVFGGNGLLKLSLTGIPTIATPDVDYTTPGGGLGNHLGNPTDAHDASAISVIPANTLQATDVQTALLELDAEKVPRSAMTGSAGIPVGTTAQRDAVPGVGFMRFNTTLQQFEGFYGGVWQSVGGGQLLGNAVTKAIFYNSQHINENLTVGTGVNGGTFGPVTVDDGFAVTVADGSVWSVV